MLKKFIAALFALIAATAFAAVDANKATQAELESVKGIGPVISSLIVSERKKSNFKDWNDLVTRVQGVGDRSAAKFSEGGLTVNGAAYAGAPATAEKAPMTARAASATKTTVAKAASAVKTGAEKAASGAKAAATTVKENVKDEKNAGKENFQEAKEKRAAAKAEKAEKAAMAASSPRK